MVSPNMQAINRRRANEHRRKLWLAWSAGFIVCGMYAAIIAVTLAAGMHK